jgi:membrane-bound lytic murein transglycosylase F
MNKLPRSHRPGRFRPIRRAMRNSGLFLSGCLCVAALSGCGPPEAPRKPWHEELTVAVSQNGSSVNAEFELQLITLFAKRLGLVTRLVPLPTDEIVPYLMANKAHIAAAGLRGNRNLGDLRFGPSYQTVNEQVVCGVQMHRLSDLPGKDLAVVAGSEQESALRETRQEMSTLRWTARRGTSVADLLGEVADGKLQCTIANNEQLATARNFHPSLHAAFDIAAPSKLAWAFSPDSNAELIAETQKFFTSIKQDGTLRSLLDRYYGHNDRLEPIDATTFLVNVRNVLPHFRQMFEDAAAQTGIEWQLLAALAYQESHWNPLATSFTNVRGMMMLTGETADRMKVKDRLDPRESIMAGARYLQMLAEQLPPHIPDRQRTWLAMAAYNQGMGHLEDARILTARAGLNPDSWMDVRTLMPKLAQPEYYEGTKHGFARGGEAVVLVESVRQYYDMLNRLTASGIPSLSASPYYLQTPNETGLLGLKIKQPAAPE